MTQENFEIYWQRGLYNELGYFTKQYDTLYHRNIQNRYIRDKIQRSELNITSQLKKLTSFHCGGVLIQMSQRYPVINKTDIKSSPCDRLARMALSDDISTFGRPFRNTQYV